MGRRRSVDGSPYSPYVRQEHRCDIVHLRKVHDADPLRQLSLQHWLDEGEFHVVILPQVRSTMAEFVVETRLDSLPGGKWRDEDSGNVRGVTILLALEDKNIAMLVPCPFCAGQAIFGKDDKLVSHHIDAAALYAARLYDACVGERRPEAQSSPLRAVVVALLWDRLMAR